MHPGRRWLLVLVALLVAGFALASCGDGDDAPDPTTETTQTETTTTTQTTTPEPEPPTLVRVRVVGGTPEGGIVRETVDKGDWIVLVVTSDVADEVHLHGYDFSRDIAAGATVRLRFRATLPGRFEVELEDRGAPIADFTVEP